MPMHSKNGFASLSYLYKYAQSKILVILSVGANLNTKSGIGSFDLTPSLALRSFVTAPLTGVLTHRAS